MTEMVDIKSFETIFEVGIEDKKIARLTLVVFDETFDKSGLIHLWRKVILMKKSFSFQVG